MRLHYDEDLIESAVFVCASGRGPNIPSMQLARFHRQREKLYAILDPERRKAAFLEFHWEWFQEWNLQKTLTIALEEFAGLSGHLNSLAFRKARASNEEGAELYVNPERRRTAVLALRAERFARPEELTAFLRHEFMHLNDMVDAVFGYSPNLDLAEPNAAEQRLARERYRLLWDITIDGRLTRGSRATLGGRDDYRSAFDRAFGFWPEPKRAEVFASLWEGDQPRHQELVALAAHARELQGSHDLLPGAPCPLCDFPTFDWVVANNISPDVATAVAAEFPHWTPHQGLCHRCHEVYEAARQQTQSA